MTESKKPLIAMNFLGILILLLVAAVFVSSIGSLNPNRELAYRAMCMTNLNGIGKSIILYEASYEAMPFEFGPLVKDGFASEKMFVCPASAKRLGREKIYYEPDYVLAIAGPGSMSASAVLAFELPINHDQKQVNYLTYGGGVACVRQPDMNDFITVIQDTNDMLAAKRDSVNGR